MKRFALALIGSILLSLPSFSQDKKPSPAKTTEMNWGEKTMKIEYSSPSVKGRTIYGDLVPYDKIWRAGANEATTMEFNKDVKVNGQDLPAGKYAFFVIPSEGGEWTLIFNKESQQWGAYKYKESEDALRVKAKPSEIDPTESLTYRINDKGDVYLDWSTTRIGFKVQ